MSDIFRDFDKKNEVPKVKIPKFATGGIYNDAIFPKLDAFSQIDEIVKDIAKKKDNAIAMEFTKCIGELLKKNGVIPKISEYRMENHTENKIEMRYGVSIDELDFSEHDKVFGDKIAELKKDYKTVSGLLSDYQQENESLKQRIAELESENEQLKHDIDKMAESKSEWIDRAVEWQQKCEKLESKETVELPFDPLECANYLINATYKRETNGIERAFHHLPEKVNSDRYTVDDLEQIAEHLLVYCKHNKESE